MATASKRILKNFGRVIRPTKGHLHSQGIRQHGQSAGVQVALLWQHSLMYQLLTCCIPDLKGCVSVNLGFPPSTQMLLTKTQATAQTELVAKYFI